VSDVFALRGVVDAARLQLDTALAAADDNEVWLQRLRNRIADGTFEGVHGHSPEGWLAIHEERQAARRQQVDELGAALADARGQLTGALDAGEPLFPEANGDPIALLPVRIETRFTDATTIAVRVYPDDLHIDAFDPRLTRAELHHGRAYWEAPDDAAWERVLGVLSPARAAWATRATRPGAPDPQMRGDQERLAPQVWTLPSRWRFLGLTGGRLVVDEVGADIPVPLPLSLLAVDERPTDSDDGAWAVDFPAAVRVGMAATLRLPEHVDHLDQLFVIGVRLASADQAGERLRGTLLGHSFGAGLGFLQPGTSTNNTPQSRSGWSSRPTASAPAPKEPKLARETDAGRLADALGLSEASFLAECPGGAETSEQTIAGLSLLSWGALGQGIVDAAHTLDLRDLNGLPFHEAPWRSVRDHLVNFVRSRGTLPTIRVGHQPYGVLPVTSVDEWVPADGDGADALIQPWLLRLRHHWRAALAPGWVPRVTDGVPADRVAVDVLSRLPVAIDLVVRRLLSPNGAREKLGPTSAGPVLSVGGIAPGANLRWTMPTELTSNLAWTSNTTKADYALVTERLAADAGDYTEVLAASRELMSDALAVVEGTLSPTEYEQRWPMELMSRAEPPPPRRDTIFAFLSSDPPREFIPALLDPGNWSAWPEGDSGIDDPLTQALALPATADGLVWNLLNPEGGGDEQLLADAHTSARKGAVQAPRIIAALAALEATPRERRVSLALEVLDVFSHRLDAWITSLAASRLSANRAAGLTAGIRIGGYGWVENLRRTEPGEKIDIGNGAQVSRSPADGYVHAPSLHHAATAAVLRSGFLAHEGEETFAVNLTSRRARIARWLLAGVRRGQELGSLLGYRFERALHDAGKDELIDDFRARYPASVAPEPLGSGASSDLWERSAEAIAARNVVDGMALARDAQLAAETFPAAQPMLADLVDALDAVSDLLLAESVHQLVGGNAMRAGLAADTLGRGEDVPDRFDVMRTPHRGRAVTQRVAAMLPAAPTGAAGWAADALSALDPRVEAWVADALGPAGRRRLTGTLRLADNSERPFDVSAQQLGLGALTMVLEVASADHARLDRRITELEEAAGATVRYEGQAWQELRGVATRIRSLLAAAQPLLPGHLATAETATEIVPDFEELRGRISTFAASLAPVEDDSSPAGRLTDLAAQEPEPGWFSSVLTAIAEVLSTGVPVAPLLTGVVLGPPPAGASEAEVADWVRRFTSTRPAVRTWHELLLLTAASNGRSCQLIALQSPITGNSEAWIGGSFSSKQRPAARQHLVCHTPSPAEPGTPLAGIVFDEWVEVLPGSDALAETKTAGDQPVPAESELTGLSFHFDRPDAKAPQAILVAVPPNTARGWTPDGLALVIRDTLELAKLRAVDLGDLPLLDDILPALRLNRFGPLGGLAADFWHELAE
jgi:hypothetical protein